MKTQRIILGIMLLSMTNMYGLWDAPDSIGVPSEIGKHGYIVAPEVQYDLAYRAFDSNKDEADLNKLVFGKENVEIQDIFLASRLARLRKTNANVNEYLTLLSTCTVDMNLQQERLKFSLAGSVTLPVSDSINLTFGVELPVEYYQHKMRVQYLGSKLGSTYFGANAVNKANEGYFFTQNSNLDTFMKREVLDPKGLKLLENQRSFGLGSAKFAALVDLSEGWDDQIEKMQFGALAVFKAPQQDTSNIVWAAERGVGGNYIGANVNVAWDVRSCWRPFVSGQALRGLYSGTKMRIPKQKTRITTGSDTLAANSILTSTPHDTGISINAGTAGEFTLYDSTVPFFADQAIMVERRRGTLASARVGNRMLFKKCCDVSVFYEIRHKSKDDVRSYSETPSGTYDFNMMMNRTNQISHTIGWQAQYGLKGGAVISAGSMHVLKGENNPKYHSLSFRMEAAF